MTTIATWHRFWFASVLSVLVVGSVLDVIAYRLAGNDATLSVFLRKWARDWPIALWGSGLITGLFAGHWWWGQRQPAKFARG